MRYDAVIFDLYGTLVDNFPGEAFESTAADMASCLGVPLLDFVRWRLLIDKTEDFPVSWKELNWLRSVLSSLIWGEP